MALSAGKMTRDSIDRVKVLAPAITVTTTSTTSATYQLFRPMAEAAAVVAADAQRALFSISYLASHGKYLDNVLRDINVERLPHETDESVRINAAKIFTPDSVIDTDIDPDIVANENEQLDDIRPKTTEQLYAQMKAWFFRLVGVTDRPCMGARYWEACAFRLREFYDHIVSMTKDYITEDSDDINNTDWIYNFDARRVPGVRDSKVQISDYNELTIYVYIDERISTNSRGQRLIYNESEIVSQVNRLANNHLPQPDHITLKAPALIVKPAPTKHVLVEGSYRGTADLTDVKEAIEDYFYDNKTIGEPLTQAGIDAAVLAVSGVTAASIVGPTDMDLRPTAYELLDVGYMDIRVV